MSTRLQHIVVDANDPSRLARFWAQTLGWRVVIEGAHEVEIEGGASDVNLIFVPVPEPKRSKNRIHLDLTTGSVEEQRERVGELLALGATRIDIGQGDVAWTVLGDPEGNEFCVVPQTSSGGAVAAIAYDANDAATLGRFWSAASGWPIVYEKEHLCVLHAPNGAGPVITVAGPPERVAPKPVKNRMHIDVAPFPVNDHRIEVERLTTLGARPVDIGQGEVPWVVMADPEDNEFCVLTPR